MADYFSSTEAYTNLMVHELLKQKEEYIRVALVELISRGLIVIEENHPVLIKIEEFDAERCQFKLVRSIRLVPKEFEYIQKLEAENKELKEKLDKIKELL
jgi:hypothetical protein